MDTSKSVRQTRRIYILYFIGAILWPVLLAGVVFAYMAMRSINDDVLSSHLRQQVRVFWTHLLSGVAVGIGVVMLLFIFSIFALGWSASGNMDAAVIFGMYSYVILPIVAFLSLATYVVVASLRGLNKLNLGDQI